MNSTLIMKTCMIILLQTLLCAERAQGRRCFQCFETSGESSCQPANCVYPDGVCITQNMEIIQNSKKVNLKNKYCLPACPEGIIFPSNMDFLGVVVHTNTSCCTEDLCNAAGLVGGSPWTLVGALVFSLGPVLLQVLP